eukprot:8286009-Ditylum_brightwellii.AAC.1
MENQNHFLENQISVAINGFEDIILPVEDQDVTPADEVDTSMEGMEPSSVPLNMWLLRERVLDRSKLIISIKRGPRGVQYFYTTREKKEEMIKHIDNLENVLQSQFGYE